MAGTTTAGATADQRRTAEGNQNHNMNRNSSDRSNTDRSSASSTSSSDRNTSSRSGSSSTSTSGRSNTGTSPATLEKYLAGISFPADKSQLIQHAQKNNAPNDVIQLLNQFDDKDYRSVIDVSKEMGRVE